MTTLFLLDVDGVLADDRHRQEHYAAGDFSKYFSKEEMEKDTVWPEGQKLYDSVVNLPKARFSVGVLTSRRKDLSGITREWFKNNGMQFPQRLMFFKPFKFAGTSAEYKLGVMQSIVDGGEFDIVVLYEDDPHIVSAVKEARSPKLRVVHCSWHVKPDTMLNRT